MEEQGEIKKLYTGPVSANKTSYLIDMIRDTEHGRKKVLVIRAVEKVTEKEIFIEDCDGRSIPAYGIPAEHPEIILELLQAKLRQGEIFKVVALDEVHLFSAGFTKVLRDLLSYGISVLASGLNFDSRGEPYPAVASIYGFCKNSSQVEFCHSWCSRCGCEARFSQEIEAGAFEPRCYKCFEPRQK